MQLKAERLPRVSPRRNAPEVETEYVGQLRQPRYSWAWNLPLLLASITILVVGGSAVAGAYLWQSRRLSTELLDRAAAAEEAHDYQEQVKWLTRYVRLTPDDTQALIRLGIANDNTIKTYSQLDGARARLAKAIAATGDQSVFESQRTELRKRLIKRLLQLGDMWAYEAQRQVIFLAAAPEDAQALSWLAQAMAEQRLAQLSRPSDAKASKDKEYWSWMAQQPVGLVLREALKHNPDDLQLATYFLSAVVSTPDWFEGSEQAPTKEELQKDAEELSARLAAREDSGRAQLLAYSFQVQKTPELAATRLEAALPGALARLSENLAAADPTERDDESALPFSATNTVPLLEDGVYTPYWDWELAHRAAAQALNGSKVKDALTIYQQLLTLSSPAVSRPQREATFLAAGQAYWRDGNTDKALEVWTAGNEALQDSVDLPGALLNTLTELGRMQEAESVLKELESSIKSQRTQLDGVQGLRLGSLQKERARTRLDQAGWQADVIHGKLQIQRGFYRDACTRLAKAFSSPLQIDSARRINCGRMLAECYSELQLWDLAGQTLDECVVLAPEDVALRRAAAEAWSMVGSAERVASQLDAMDDESFAAALEIARLKAAANSSQPPEQQDPQSVRDALQVARLRWEALPEQERASQPIWLLEALEIAYAERKADDRASGPAALAALAKKYATNRQVQMLALANLARQGDVDSAKLALGRLQKIAEVSGAPEDARDAIIAEAVIAEASGDIDAALRILREGIAGKTEDAVRLAKLGATIAAGKKRYKAAYELLRLVPEENWDVEAFMLAGRLGLSGDSADELAITATDLQRWEQKLRELEGENGCNWRYLEAKRLIGSIPRNSDSAALLDKAESHYHQIERSRPHWGVGAALGGQIAAFKGEREKAITLLRQALQDGDTQASTVFLLVSELTALDRLEEAEQELKRLSNIPEIAVPTSMWEIAVAQRKGDLRAALDIARKSTSRNYNDANAWLSAAQIASGIARAEETSAEEKIKLQAEAWDALEHAARLTSGKDINVWNARFRFHLEAGDKERAKEELKALESSPMPKEVSLLASATGYLLLQDFETAQARVKEAIALDPDASRPHVALARILEQMGDRPGMLSELQAAYRVDKNNTDIRERLAVAYVIASEEIPWSEVDQLLAGSADSISTRSTLLRAVLSLQRGDADRSEAALATLNSIAHSSLPEATIAKRVLAKQYATQYVKADSQERASPLGRLNLEQARSLYQDLMDLRPPAAVDGVPFALLLIEADQLDEAKKIADKLSAAGTSSLVLQLRLKIAKLQGEDLSSVASAWIASASGFEEEQLWEQVGKAMSQLELNDEALVWFEKAYTKDPKRFAAYAVGLARAGQTKQAVDLCLAQIQKDGNVAAATLLPEIVLIHPDEQQSEAVEQALATAIKEHADSPQLLEAVATLRLMQERFTEAVALYEQVDRLAPNRARTLNNLAMALVEQPGREEAALQKITKAIQIYGKYPQLLDTLAIVQSRLGQHEKAKATLEEAIAREKDPRFQMRLAEELIALGDQAEAQKIWEQIEIGQLKATGLTAAEQRSLAKLSKELAPNE